MNHIDHATKLQRSACAICMTAALLSFMLLGGCDNTLGIFSSIAGEKAQTGADLFKDVTVHAMAEDATHYFALLAKVVYRPIDKSAGWETLAINGSTDYYAPGLASDGTTIYVAKANANNVLEDIYKSTNAGSASAAWTSMNATASLPSNIYSIQWLRCANDTLFVAVRILSNGTYALFYHDGSTFTSAGPAVSALTRPLIDVVWNGSEYWVISDSAVFHGTAGSIAEDTTPGLASGILGIAADPSDGRVLISRSDGTIYDYSSGSWNSVTIKTSIALGPLFILNTPAVTPPAPRLLIGRSVSAYGYMELQYAAPLNASTLKENGTDYLSATKSVYLSTAAGKRLVGFWQSSSGSRELFMMIAAGGTSSYALYRNACDASANNGAGSWSGWTAE